MTLTLNEIIKIRRPEATHHILDVIVRAHFRLNFRGQLDEDQDTIILVLHQLL